ncbi:unnamed protein product [Rotaria sp. Silwood1]|nr:unnamed protein product [Rotaria sp. Silwood1]CAF4764669.1 unnamed protein product [Rotaria sp. Silwood1]
MISEKKNKIVPFNKIQGIASTNVPAYSNEDENFISFEASYVHGIFTGFKWQCVEYARRWLLLRKSCIFQSIGSAADMWLELTYIERVTDGEKFYLKTYLNGSPYKPKRDSLLIYPCSKESSHGHVAIICEVQENFIRVAEQNYQFHYWSSNYARQIPLIFRNGLYYIEDYENAYGWMEIENNNQLEPLDESNIKLILAKYQHPQPVGELQRRVILNKAKDYVYSLFDIDNRKEKFLIQCDDDDDVCYYQANEDFFVNISSTSNELYRLFMQVTDYTIHNNKCLTLFEIPNQFWSRIRRSWTEERNLNIMSHMTFNFDGKILTLCQYPANQALRILQSAIAQEKWTETMNLNCNFTSSFQLHPFLVRQWKRLNIKTIIHILIDNDEKDLKTILYMQDIMTEAGINSKLCRLPNDLYWKHSRIVDKDGEMVEIVWKLRVCETIFQDLTVQYQNNIADNDWKSMNNEHPCINDILLNEKIRIIEPLWKSITNHPAFLSVLYTMFPNHPNLLKNKRISSEHSEHLPFTDWSIKVKNDNINKIYDATKNVIMNKSIKKRFNNDLMSQEILSGEISDETIVSWIIGDSCYGFSICENPNCFIDANNLKTYCCVI